MSVRHLERWPSADWDEIWFPVHVSLHPPGRVRKWVRAQIAAIRPQSLSVTPNFGYEVIEEERGSEGSFLPAHDWRQELGGELYRLGAIRPDHTFFTQSLSGTPS